MRSPYPVGSSGMRYVDLVGGLYNRDAVSGGFGVRPALLSERNYAFAVLGLLASCALCQF